MNVQTESLRMDRDYAPEWTKVRKTKIYFAAFHGLNATWTGILNLFWF